MLKTKKINRWDRLIEESRDLDLARKFYPKAGRPERVKEVFKNSARHFASYDMLLQEKFEQGAYRPELTDEEVMQIAAEEVQHDFENEWLRELFGKLEYPVYAQANFSDDQMKDLVSKVLREGGQGYEPGENPREFAQGLIEYPDMHECPGEVSFTYSLLNHERYGKYAEPELARNISTLKVFHDLLLGRFSEASEIRNKHKQHYDEALARQLVGDFVEHKAFTEEDYPLEYLVAFYGSEFGSMLNPRDVLSIDQRAKNFDDYVEQHKTNIPEDVDIGQAKEKYLSRYKRLNLARQIAYYLGAPGHVGGEVRPTAEMDKAVGAFGNEDVKFSYAQKRGLPYEKTRAELDADELNKAFDWAEDEFRMLVGMRTLEWLLSNKEYVESVGEEKVREILNQRTAKAMQDGKANVVYALRFGTNLGHSHRYPAVPHFDEYVDVDKSSLLESMISALDCDPEYLLSDQYNLGSDGFTFGGAGYVEDAYDLYQTTQQERGKLPSTETMRKLIFLKMATHMKEYYEGNGMRTVRDVFEDPANSQYINPDQTRRLLTKVFDCWGKSRVGGFMEAEAVPYFYALVSSKLGDLVRDDKRLAPYFELHQFIEEK